MVITLKDPANHGWSFTFVDDSTGLSHDVGTLSPTKWASYDIKKCDKCSFPKLSMYMA